MSQDQNAIDLFNYLLSCKYPAARNQIEQELGFSRATFFRAKDTAERLFGPAIECDKKYGGYFLKKGDSLQYPRPFFSMSEIQALVLIEQALWGIQKGLLADVLKPIRERFVPLLENQKIPVNSLRDKFKIVSVFCRPVDDQVFRTAFNAINRKKCIEMGYRSLGSEEEQHRTVSPFTIVRYRDNWYLDAFCHQRGGLRTFAMSRITTVLPSKEKFHPVDRKILRNHFSQAFGIFTGPALKTARIRFTGIAAVEIQHETWHPKQHCENLPDNSCILTIPYGNDTELVMDILKWGKDAEVLEPEDLRKRVREVIGEMRRKYEEE